MNADDLSRIAMSASLGESLARAVELARAQGHLEVTLEHMLLSLCEDPDAGLVLAASNIDVARLKAETSGYLAALQLRAAPGQSINPSVALDLRRILEAAAAAARGGRRREINGAIVLAAVVGDGRSPAARLLQAQGLTFDGAIRALQQGGAAVPRQRPNTEEILASARERVQSRTALVRKADVGDEEEAAQEPAASPAAEGAGAAATKPAPSGETPAPAAPASDTVPESGAPVVATPSEPQPAPQPEPTPAPAPAAATTRDKARMPSVAPPAPMPATTTDDARLPSPAPASPPAPPPIPGVGSSPSPFERERAAPQPFDAGTPLQTPAALTPPLAAPAQSAPPAAAPPAVPPPLPPMRTLADAPRPDRVGGEVPRAVPPPPARWPDMGDPGREPRVRPKGVGAAVDGGPSKLRSVHTNRGMPASAPSAPQPVGRPLPAQRAEIGQLVENIPRSMRVAVPALVEVRVAKADVQALAEGLQGGGAAYKHEVTITKAMSVRLRAPDGGFFIETASPETQWIEKTMLLSGDDYASWRWHITPREKGRKRLQLIISARTVSTDGLAAETALPDQVITVRVRTNYAKSASHLVGWGVAALIGGLLARFGEGAFDAGMQIVSKLMPG